MEDFFGVGPTTSFIDDKSFMECVFLILVDSTMAKAVLDNADKKMVKNPNSCRSREALINCQEIPVHTSRGQTARTTWG